MNFYTYMYLRGDATPYYVGQGTGNRAFESHRGAKPPRLSTSKYSRYDRSRVLIQSHPNKADALTAEKFLIAYYGRKDLGTGILHNLTDGGDVGPTGHKHTAEALAKISAASVGNTHCVGKTSWNKGKTWSELAKQMRLAKLNNIIKAGIDTRFSRRLTE